MTFDETRRMSDARAALADVRTWIEAEAMDARAKGRIDPRLDEAFQIVFSLELLLAEHRDAPEPLRHHIIKIIVSGVTDLAVPSGHIQH